MAALSDSSIACNEIFENIRFSRTLSMDVLNFMARELSNIINIYR